MFASFLRPGADEVLYEEVKDVDRMVKLLSDYMEEYNETHHSQVGRSVSCPSLSAVPSSCPLLTSSRFITCFAQMNLVFFEDAVKHLVRVSRVLNHSRGSAMLIGIGGSGKQSLTRLAAAIADCACSQIEATASYSPQDFREDLKEVMHVAGVEGKHVVLLLSDTQVR
jgi:dynein heavy chain